MRDNVPGHKISIDAHFSDQRNDLPIFDLKTDITYCMEFLPAEGSGAVNFGDCADFIAASQLLC